MRDLVDTNAHKLQPSLSERVVVDGHGCHTALYFGVKAKENHDKVPTLYWLPKLHIKPIKQVNRLLWNLYDNRTFYIVNLMSSSFYKTRYQVL